jgi:hypothetical protein
MKKCQRCHYLNGNLCTYNMLPARLYSSCLNFKKCGSGLPPRFRSSGSRCMFCGKKAFVEDHGSYKLYKCDCGVQKI